MHSELMPAREVWDNVAPAIGFSRASTGGSFDSPSRAESSKPFGEMTALWKRGDRHSLSSRMAGNSHNLAKPFDPCVTNKRLSAEKTNDPCTSAMSVGGGGGLTSQKRTVESNPALTNRRPSGEKARAATVARWP